MLFGCSGTKTPETPETAKPTDAVTTEPAGESGGAKKVANVVAEYNEWNQLFFDEMDAMAKELYKKLRK